MAREGDGVGVGRRKAEGREGGGKRIFFFKTFLSSLYFIHFELMERGWE